VLSSHRATQASLFGTTVPAISLPMKAIRERKRSLGFIVEVLDDKMIFDESLVLLEGQDAGCPLCEKSARLHI
jgi:hypothetical protein